MIKVCAILFFLSNSLFAQATYTETDVEICNSKFELAVSKNLENEPIGFVIAEIGKSFLGIDYEAFTLEKGDKETVVINLSGLDCYTFYESTLALARCIKLGENDFESYLAEIENIRYRNGKMDGYISRLHYAVDWLYDNQQRGHIKDITKEIGGERFDKKVGFMGQNPHLYKRLKNSPESVEQIIEIENEINTREYYYIPQEKIELVEDKINDGDIIYCTTNLKGLLISHTGIAVKSESGRIHFMHAPIKGSKVQISTKPLPDYIKSIKKHTGIMVLRPNEPDCGCD